MLIFAILLTLLCSSLSDARLAPVDSPEALALCLDQPHCNKPALEINPATFHPVIKRGGVNVNVTVRSNQPLTFRIRAENYAVKWGINPPGEKCLWEIGSNGKGGVTFREFSSSETMLCNVDLGIDVSIHINGNSVDITGNFDDKPTPKKLSNRVCAQPDSDSIPGWDIWSISMSASTSAPSASITLKDAYVVYDAPEKPTAPQCGSACLECVRSMLSSDTN